MLRWIVGTSLKFRFLVVAGAAVLMFFGMLLLPKTPVDAFPEFAPPRVEIQVPCLGLSATEVEELVTVPMEQALAGIPGLDVMRSKSVTDLAQLDLRFERDTDLLRARQLVAERVQLVSPSLPKWASPPFMIQPLSSTSRAMKIGLSSETKSVIEMSMTAYWTIRSRLLRVPGVANTTIYGERLQMYQVQTDPNRMAANQVSLNQVMLATANALDAGLLQFSDGGFIGTGGFVETPNQRLAVQHVLPIVTPEDLAQVTLAQRDGRTLKLSDVANVVEDHQPLIGDAVINDGPGLMLIVEKFPWANTVDVTEGVEAAINELRPGLSGIEIDTTIFRPATFITQAIDNLTLALLIGCLLVILIIGAFLFEWRSALISVVAIPISLVAAGLVLYWTGAVVNTMILAGLVVAVGVVVDDAIIDVENILRRLRQHRAQGGDTRLRSTARIILEASLEVRGAIFYATVITLVAVMPVFFIGGLSGSFFRPLIGAYALAVGASLLVALTVTPALALILLRGAPLERRESPVMRMLRRGYTAVLSRTVRSPKPAYAMVGVIIALGVAVFPLLGQSLLPSFKERDFLMHWLLRPGAGHTEMIRVTEAASRELRAIPGVRNFGAHVGQALLADEPYGIDFTENWISIDPNVDYDATLAKVQEVVDGYPGLQRDVQTYLKERVKEVLTGSSDSIVVRIYGPQLPELRAKADEVRKAMEQIDGTVDLKVERLVDVPQIQVTVDLEAAQRYGLKPGDVRRATATVLSGEEVGDIFRGGRAYDVQVWTTPATRQHLDDIRAMPIDTPGGERIRLDQVAALEIVPTPNHVDHYNTYRKIDVTANVKGRDLGSVAREVADRVSTIQFAQEYHPEVLGEYAERQAASARLNALAIAAAVVIFILLVTSFRSTRLAVLSFVTLPSALVGGVLAAWLGGGVLSLGSLIGFLAVFGIAARNGIMLISHYQHLERYEGVPFGRELVIRGARERLAPILMTTLATALALVPLVVAGSVPGNEIEHPMATVILGGLVTSTLLNLFVVPSLYLRFGGRKRPASAAPPAPVGAG
ncbi:efflux RND transporter permease subunit [Pseudonocardia hispaniensis]|uniref:Efflux RND transporter permease subunit n=1 Tax=Pseudonocardia hispaniensis TaxID=904933 RepID=A0ABW1J3D8_9PSEU